MHYRSAFRKSLLFSVLSLLLSAPAAFPDTAPIAVSSVQSAANTGAVATSVPIDVPPGRKGIQPNLALTYNSNSPNGWLGVGWSLDMGSIQRSTKRGVSYSANDYVANGVELVARVEWGTGYYGAKIEGAFSKYYFDSSTGGWVVTTKDGTKYYCGTTSASRQDSTLGVFKWCLDKVVDTNGNYMTVSYWNDNGEIYLDRIEYTGNVGVSPTNSVQFSREVRTDAPVMYLSNAPVKTNYRLKSVEVYGNGQLARKYILNYDYSVSIARTLLSSITQYGSDGNTALPARTFQWQNSVQDPLLQERPATLTTSTGKGYTWIGDFNGDGRADIATWADGFGGSKIRVHLSTGSGFTIQEWATNLSSASTGNGFLWLGDFNGDGKTDIAGWADGFSGSKIRVHLSTGSGFTIQEWATILSLGAIYTWSGDFNGDGKTDIASWADGFGGSKIRLHLSTGSSFTIQEWATNLSSASTGNGFLWLGDFNGDGKTDIAGWADGFSGSKIRVHLSTGSGFTIQEWATILSLGAIYTWTGDFNGDGKTDIASWADGFGGSKIRVHLSTGSGFTVQEWATNLSSASTGNGFLWLGDFNGDGKTDIAAWGDNYRGTLTRIHLSTGSGFVIQEWSTILSLSRGDYTWAGDFNGDGKADLASFADGSGGSKIQMHETRLQADLLSTLTNGLGAATTITYKPSSSYTNGLLPFVVQTVSSISVNDGNGNTSTTNYTYSGGLYEPVEREFRGFSYVKATDGVDTTSEATFLQDATYKGLLYYKVIKSASGNKYSETLNNYSVTSPATGVSFPYLYWQDNYEYDGTPTARRPIVVFSYDTYGNIIGKYNYGDFNVTGDERSETTEYGYDTANWIVALPSHSYVLDSGGVKKAEGWYSYDPKGNLLTETRWLSGGSNPVVTYGYDDYGNRTSVKDAKNNTTTIVYDTIARTYPETITNAVGHSATKTYDYKFGKPLNEADANGNATSYTYDVFGRVVKVTGPLDTGSTYGTVTYSYDSFGTVGSQKVTTYRTEQGGTSNYLWEENYFDGLGRTFKTRREGPDSKIIVQQSTFDQRGLMTAKSLPYFGAGLESPRWTTFAYDAVGRVIQVSNPDGTSTSTAYDKGKTTITTPNLDKTLKKVEEKDVYGRLKKVEEYNGSGVYATTQYQYDTLGNLKKTIDHAHNQTNIDYDTLGRKISMNDPDMGTWTYGYDANGNLTTQTDAKGQTITFAYDALNRVTKKDYPTGTDAVYTYDETTSSNGKGRLTTLTDASGTSKYWYDVMGRATRSTRTIDGTAYTTETAYDALSRITSVKYPDNETINYTYDAGSNLYQVGGYATYADYNALGQTSGITYGNGVSTIYQYYTTTTNRLYSITTAKGAQPLINQSYTYDNVGNIKTIIDYIDASRNQSFDYDDLNRLKQAASTAYGTLAYGYNEIGNMIAKEGVNYTYPTPSPSGVVRPHAVTATSDGKTYTYDSNGNMTNDGTRTIAYDYDNMPSSVTSGAGTISFVYDASGQRVKRIAPSGTTIYVSKLYECSNGGACTKYIMANGNKLAWKNSAGTFYYHQDHLGSSRVITNASGVLQEEIVYKPFGSASYDNVPENSALSRSASEYGAKHKFTSQEYDAETGLYYYNARYYNPELGRFVSPDSIVPNPRDPQALNRYSYVLNNPLIYTDPTGHSWLSKIGKKISNFFRKLDVAVEVNVSASYSTTYEGGYSSGSSGSAPQRQSERRSSACSGGSCVGSATTTSGSSDTYSESNNTFNEVGTNNPEVGGPRSLQKEWVFVDPNGDLFVNPTGGEMRGCDSQGCGYYGAGRGVFVHLGLDLKSIADQNVIAPFEGRAYLWPSKAYPGVQIISERYTAELLYIKPTDAITKAGARGLTVSAGQFIGTALDITKRYPGITNHIHFQLRKTGESLFIRSTPFIFTRGAE